MRSKAYLKSQLSQALKDYNFAVQSEQTNNAVRLARKIDRLNEEIAKK